jgi:exopolyphosphatase/guanosine-5'-triphosphate,3'-diphosphate pyrophosphatase
MARRRSGRRPRSAAAAGRVGVIDIGSNSIRLVVFHALCRAPQPVFNEKVLCGLGRGLERSGRLDAEGVELALDNLRRFAALARTMDVRRLMVLATAAARDAANGRDFVAAIARRTGLKARILSGAEEARMSALGVVSGMPDADGLMGDLGGGSLELVRLAHGRLGRGVTLPYGPLRLAELALKRRRELKDLIDQALAELPWLDTVVGRNFYAVGGAWRSLARIHMGQQNYPLHVIHHYTIARDKAEGFLDLIAHLGRDSLEGIEGVPRKRLETLPLAALVLERILRRTRPKSLVFSAMGLREGCLYDALTPALRRQDPLLAACEQAANAHARYTLDAHTLYVWARGLFGKTSGELHRLRLAACALGDLAWSEHPDYRAEIGFLRVLRMPLTGVDHPGRAYLALAVFARYEGSGEGDVARPARKLLVEEEALDAVRLGLALRLAYTLSAGAAGVLRRTTVKFDRTTLKLVLPKSVRVLVGETLERHFEALARAFGKTPAIVKGRA